MKQKGISNRVILCGVADSEFVLSYEDHGECFYEGFIKVSRLSTAVDRLPVTLPGRFLAAVPKPGDLFALIGELHSRNDIQQGRSKLLLSVFVKEVMPPSTIAANSIELVGYLCKAPQYRTTPFGREISDVLLAVNRNYNKSDYIPVVVWGDDARYVAQFSVGDKVSLKGRLQSRGYVKVVDGESVSKVAYEVSTVSMRVLSPEAGD